MARPKVKDGVNAVDYRRSLLLSAAIATLVTAMAGVRPASAQSVTGSSALSYPGSIQTPHWSVGGDLYVGLFGTGSLDIIGGGTVSGIGFASIGTNAGDQGTVTVSGHDCNGNASTWTNTSTLNIGDSGIGQLFIQDGGVVNSGQGLIGSGSAGPNSVSGVDGHGNASTWNAANIYVGYSSSGSLTIADGGTVTSSLPGGAAATVYLGYSTGGQGTVNVSSSNGNVWPPSAILIAARARQVHVLSVSS